MIRFFSSPKVWFVFAGCGLMLWFAMPSWAGTRMGGRQLVVPAEPIPYTGTFTLVQHDGSGCRFADAPLTSGQFTLNSDWLASTAAGSLQGGGSGVRAGLRCGNTVGDMHWQQAYSASFSGSADREAGTVTLTGSLSGSNNVTWHNCQENGEPIDCPAGYSDPYTFPIALQGTINTVGGSGSGTWTVNNIALTTTGDWTVTGPALTATPSPTPTDTETPTPTPTATEEICPGGLAPQATDDCTSLDLTVKQVEIVQAIQCLEPSTGDTTCPDNSVPLVSYKQTAVRLYVGLGDIPQPPVDGVTARLRGFRNGQEFADSPLTPVNGGIRALNIPNRGATNDTLNFRLPHDWLTGDIEIELEVNPNRTLAEKNYQNNTLRRPVSFGDQPILRLAYLPITYLGATPSAIDDKFYLLYKLYPVGYGRIRYERWPGFDWPTRLSSENALDLIAELKRRYLLAGSPVDQLIGWLPQDRPVSPAGKSDPAHFFGCWSNCGRTVWLQAGGLTDAILAHELAHNLGRNHTGKEDGCGNVAFSTDWIYATSDIQEVGFDPWTMQVIPSDQKDLMTDCFPKWVSPWTYKKLFRSQAQVQHRQLSQAQPYLLISGEFYQTGGGQLQPTYHFTSPLTFDLTSSGNDGCLVLQNAAAQTLAEHCFALDFQDQETGAELAQIDFVATLPDPGGVGQIQLQRAATAVATVTVSAHAPLITLTTPTSGDQWSGIQSIAWQASDEDGDALTYAVLYSPDQGATWLTLATSLTQTQSTVNSQELAGGNNALIRVMASDGFNTQSVDSPPFQVARKEPQAFILSPAAATEIAQGQALVLDGEGSDLEDDLLADDQFQWRSDRTGALGQGRSVRVMLDTLGVHQITLTVTDSDGNSGTATLSLSVRAPQRSLFLPLVRRAP